MTAFSLQRADTGELQLIRDDACTIVHLVACFPWSAPRAYLSLRDDAGVEQLFIPDLDSLTGSVRQVLEDELAQRNFLPRVQQITQISEDIELFIWHVVTQAGPRTLMTKRRDHLRQVGHRVVIRDVSNDLFIIDDIRALDPRSVAWISVYLD